MATELSLDLSVRAEVILLQDQPLCLSGLIRSISAAFCASRRQQPHTLTHKQAQGWISYIYIYINAAALSELSFYSKASIVYTGHLHISFKRYNYY